MGGKGIKQLNSRLLQAGSNGDSLLYSQELVAVDHLNVEYLGNKGLVQEVHSQLLLPSEILGRLYILVTEGLDGVSKRHSLSDE